MLAEVEWGPDEEQCRSSEKITLTFGQFFNICLNVWPALSKNKSSISPLSGTDHCRNITYNLSFLTLEFGHLLPFSDFRVFYESLLTFM